MSVSGREARAENPFAAWVYIANTWDNRAGRDGTGVSTRQWGWGRCGAFGREGGVESTKLGVDVGKVLDGRLRGAVDGACLLNYGT